LQKIFQKFFFATLTAQDNGSGQLVLYESETSQEDFRQFTGIHVRVSFGEGPIDQINLLSGGQRAILALSLLFAIQKCDAAPFYIFDEIDSNLDNIHVKAVRELIKKQSSKAQFIITTHKKSMIPAGDKMYKIQFLENRVSRISCVTAQEAENILHEESISQESLSEAEREPPVQEGERREGEGEGEGERREGEGEGEEEPPEEGVEIEEEKKEKEGEGSQD